MQSTTGLYCPLVRRLPPEILSEIFLNCTSERTRVLDVEHPPWTLGMVCSRWRTVATSSPRLWSSVHINLDDVSDDRMPIAMFSETFLKRSAQRPLSLFITSRNRTGSHPLLDIIALHSTRWQEVFFCLTISAFQNLNQVRGQFPSLQRVTIGATRVEWDLPGSQFPMLNAFEFAPLLRDVHTTNYPNMESSLALPWSQLRQYSGDFWKVENAVVILHQALNVEECTLYLYEAVTQLIPIPPLQLTRLRSLSITGDTNSVPGDIVSCLTLSALEDLEIGIGYYDENLADSLNSLISRSSCSLKKLTLDAVCGVDGVEILQLLQNLHMLVELRLLHAESYMITDKLLDGLMYRSDGTLCLAPHLHSITFSGEFSCNHNLFVDMVESRFKDMHNAKDSLPNPVERLQFVGLDGCHRLELHARIRLQELRFQGLNISGREGRHYGFNDQQAQKVVLLISRLGRWRLFPPNISAQTWICIDTMIFDTFHSPSELATIISDHGSLGEARGMDFRIFISHKILGCLYDYWDLKLLR